MEELKSEDQAVSSDIYHAVRARYDYNKALKEYGSSFDTMKDQKVIDHFLEDFSEIVMQNTKPFETHEGVKFPYTSLSIFELAKKLLQRYPNDSTPVGDSQIINKKTQYIFGSSLPFPGVVSDPLEGSSMSFIEETMHQALKLLPAVIRAIRAGEVVENTMIYNLGFPTNPQGFVTEEFAKEAKENPYEAFARIYAELIQETGTSAKNIEMYGISMGANLAAETGELLLNSGEVTQEPRYKNTKNNEGYNANLPRMIVRLESPVSFGEDPSLLQIGLGFFWDQGKEGVQKQWENTKLRLRNSFFGTQDTQKQVNTLDRRDIGVKKAKAIMRERFNAIMPNTLDNADAVTQETRKKKILKELACGLGSYTPPAGLKTIQVFGKNDPSLTKPDKKEGHTIRGVDMGHMRPFFHRKREIQHLEILIETLLGKEPGKSTLAEKRMQQEKIDERYQIQSNSQ